MNSPGRSIFNRGCKGSSVVDVVIGTAIIVFIILPLFAAVIEKYIMLTRAEIIKDAVDITNISVYNSINSGYLGKSVVTFDEEYLYSLYKEMLKVNLNLNEDLTPAEHSIADGRVEIESVILYEDSFPLLCPCNIEIKRPAVHSVINVPVKPSLFREIILNMLGRQFVELKIHVDSDIPLDK